MTTASRIPPPESQLSGWQPVIGLEIHAQLSTQSKLFSGASTAYGAEPNTHTGLVDIALPGTLPVPNRAALDKAIRFGLAIGARIAPHSVFARKNYFYPDLPKGYQISQYELPVVAEGTLAVRLDDGRVIEVAIERAHLEEDAGKSLHEEFHGATGIDLNRAGTPLLEIVSKPVLYSAAEAVAYMRAVHTLVRWLGVCDGNMQEGSFRCDANVSVRPAASDKLGTRTEIKNVNSFRFVEKAIEYEIERQIRALENGEKIVQETRLYDPTRHQTRPMRGKEDANDYRYFPDPDLPPLAVTADEAALTIDASRVPASALAQLLTRVREGVISGKIAKDVFAAMWAGEGSADEVIEKRGLKQISDSGALAAAIDAVLAEYPAQLADFRGGNEKLLQFFVGQVMKRTRGQANPQQLNALLKQKLGSSAGS